MKISLFLSVSNAVNGQFVLFFCNVKKENNISVNFCATETWLITNQRKCLFCSHDACYSPNNWPRSERINRFTFKVAM